MFKKWVAALRSGQYTQGSDLLHAREGKVGIEKFCCLGVLCSLTEGLKIQTNSLKTTSYDGAESVLPRSVLNKYNLSGEVVNIQIFKEHWPLLWLDMRPQQIAYLGGPTLNDIVNGKYEEMTANLASLNDLGASFEIIARIIEDNFIPPEFR